MKGAGEVVLPAGTLVIGDLHLDATADIAPQGFLDWLEALDAPHLIVLGDLFDAWVGGTGASRAAAQAVVSGLARANRRGMAVDLLQGNRDFLLGPRFEAAAAARVHAQGLCARLGRPGGPRALFLHGDELCVHDRRYQWLRAVLRSGPARGVARSLPAGPLLALARGLRGASRREVRVKDPSTMAQDAGAARTLLAEADAEVLVCGHAHRFRDEDLGAGRRLFVVDQFGGERDALRVEAGGRLVPMGSGYRPAGTV